MVPGQVSCGDRLTVKTAFVAAAHYGMLIESAILQGLTAEESGHSLKITARRANSQCT
jgi:hypothetical protein